MFMMKVRKLLRQKGHLKKRRKQRFSESMYQTFRKFPRDSLHSFRKMSFANQAEPKSILESSLCFVLSLQRPARRRHVWPLAWLRVWQPPRPPTTTQSRKRNAKGPRDSATVSEWEREKERGKRSSHLDGSWWWRENKRHRFFFLSIIISFTNEKRRKGKEREWGKERKSCKQFFRK